MYVYAYTDKGAILQNGPFSQVLPHNYLSPQQGCSKNPLIVGCITMTIISGSLLHSGLWYTSLSFWAMHNVHVSLDVLRPAGLEPRLLIGATQTDILSSTP